MTPQTGVFPRIHTSYNTYKLLIHEMTHELPTKAIRAQLRGRCRSDAGPGRPRASPAQTGASRGRARDEPGTSRGGDCGAFRRHAPDECFHRHAPDDPDDPSPATARRAVVIGLQPAANGRGCGLCV